MSVTRYSHGMPVEYVADSATLSGLCEAWEKEKFLAVDTEFERTNTFYARIGLLQIADSNSCYIIDPLRIDDWSTFSALLANPDCTFVLHSCSEDVNLLYTFLGRLPVSVFDTQLAAAFLGIGFSISYQALVERLLGIEMVKDETRSDWIKRPLSEKQILYAATDVRYLLQIKDLLSKQIEQKGMLGWLRAECDQQLQIAKSVEDDANWQHLYASISKAWRLDSRELRILQRLCYWREQKARSRNKPRNWIVKDDDLLNLSIAVGAALAAGELTLEAISAARDVDKRFLARHGHELLSLLSGASELREVDPSLLHKPLSAAARKKLKRCQQAANSRAEELQISPELLGRKKYLTGLIRSFGRSGEIQWSSEFPGWRKEVLESKLNDIMQEAHRS